VKLLLASLTRLAVGTTRVARQIIDLLRTSNPPGYYLVADTAFPRGAHEQDVPDRIRAPLKAGDRVPHSLVERGPIMRFNRQLLSYRQTSEWGMRSLQGPSGRLRVPLPVSDVEFRIKLLENIARMNEVRTRCVGINQILNVYQPIWQGSEDSRLWNGFEGILFSEIRAVIGCLVFTVLLGSEYILK
jgi:hypothetical protein